MNKTCTAIYIRNSDDRIRTALVERATSFVLRGNLSSAIQIFDDARLDSRSQFHKLLKAASEKQFSIMVCLRVSDLDQITDTFEVFFDFLVRLEKNKIRFISIEDEFDSSGSISLAALKELFRISRARLRSERASEGLLMAKLSGKKIGRPRGDFDSQVYDLRKRGYSVRAIAEELHISTRTVQNSMRRQSQTKV